MENKKDQVCLIGVPETLEQKVSSVVRDSLQLSRKVFEYSKPVGVIIIEAQSELVIPEIGLMGRAVGKQGLEIYVDFERKFKKDELETELASTVYHELAHLVRENKVGYSRSLLDAIVSEGISCYAEKYFQPEHTIPYIASVENEQKYIQEAKLLFDKEDFDHAKWFFGSRNFPKWIGYRLGYVIVDKYMGEKKVSLAELARTNSRLILKGGKIL